MFWPRSKLGIVFRLVIVLFAMFLAACSKEELTDFAEKAKSKVTDGAQAVQQQASVVTDVAKENLSLAGNATVNLDVPIASTACYVSIITPGAGRPNVLQIRTHKETSPESFPSLLLQVSTTAASVSELVGQTVTGQLFVQAAENAPVWFCPTGEQVQLKVVSFANSVTTCEIVGGKLRNSRTGVDQTVSGKLVGVLP